MSRGAKARGRAIRPLKAPFLVFRAPGRPPSCLEHSIVWHGEEKGSAPRPPSPRRSSGVRGGRGLHQGAGRRAANQNRGLGGRAGASLSLAYLEPLIGRVLGAGGGKSRAAMAARAACLVPSASWAASTQGLCAPSAFTGNEERTVSPGGAGGRTRPEGPRAARAGRRRRDTRPRPPGAALCSSRTHYRDRVSARRTREPRVKSSAGLEKKWSLFLEKKKKFPVFSSKNTFSFQRQFGATSLKRCIIFLLRSCQQQQKIIHGLRLCWFQRARIPESSRFQRKNVQVWLHKPTQPAARSEMASVYPEGSSCPSLEGS